MIKQKKKIICQSCGSNYTRWIGRCEQCNQWNTLIEDNNSKPSGVLSKSNGKKINFEKLNDVKCEYSRIKTNMNELDRVLGGGPVMLGDGNADFDICIAKLKDIDYRGPYIMQAYRDEEGVNIFKSQLDWFLKKREKINTRYL